jgi:competence protein ComGC
MCACICGFVCVELAVTIVQVLVVLVVVIVSILVVVMRAKVSRRHHRTKGPQNRGSRVSNVKQAMTEHIIKKEVKHMSTAPRVSITPKPAMEPSAAVILRVYLRMSGLDRCCEL